MKKNLIPVIIAVTTSLIAVWLFCLICFADISQTPDFQVVTDVGSKTSNRLAVGASADLADFPNAQMIVTKQCSMFNYGYRFGLIAESCADAATQAIAVGGHARTFGANNGIGIGGIVSVSDPTDTGSAIAVVGTSTFDHNGGINAAFLAFATGSTVANYSFLGQQGVMANADDIIGYATGTFLGNLYSSNAFFTGTATAAFFVGDGSGLTGLPGGLSLNIGQVLRAGNSATESLYITGVSATDNSITASATNTYSPIVISKTGSIGAAIDITNTGIGYDIDGNASNWFIGSLGYAQFKQLVSVAASTGISALLVNDGNTFTQNSCVSNQGAAILACKTAGNGNAIHAESNTAQPTIRIDQTGTAAGLEIYNSAGAGNQIYTSSGPVGAPVDAFVVSHSGTVTANGLIFDDETLDVYNEGTWTPNYYGSVTAGTCAASATIALGFYTQVGNTVHADLTYSTPNCPVAPTGNPQFTLPVMPNTTSGYKFSCSINIPNGYALSGLTDIMTAGGNDSQQYIILREYPAGGGSAVVAPVDTSFSIVISCDYLTD
jgi:hypothetical protein